MIFARKMPEFYIIITLKIFFPNFGGTSPTPMPQICIKSIFCRGLPRTPSGGVYDAPQTPIWMVWPGHPPHVSSISVPSTSRSRRLRNEVVIGSHENGFPGPAVALDGPDICINIVMIVFVTIRRSGYLTFVLSSFTERLILLQCIIVYLRE